MFVENNSTMETTLYTMIFDAKIDVYPFLVINICYSVKSCVIILVKACYVRHTLEIILQSVISDTF